jgi:hypothetical protein
MNLRTPLVLALSTLAAACGNKEGDAKPSASGSAAATGSPAPAPASAVDPRIDALAKAVLPCRSNDVSFDPDCPAWKAWRDAKDDFNEGKSDASLVAMLSDSDEKVRYLGAYKLSQSGRTFWSDKTMAAAVVAAAEKEKSKFVGYELGVTVGKIRVRDTGTFDRVKALVQKHDVPALRGGIVSSLFHNNADYEPAYNLLRDTVKDADKAVALAALGALGSMSSRAEATCQLYLDNIDDANDDLAAAAASLLSFYGKCSSKYDALLDSLEKRVKTGPGAVQSMGYLSSARNVCEDAMSNDKQKKRAAELGRAVAGKKEFKAKIRSAALDTVIKCDTSGGRSFIGQFTKDPEKSVADRANELLAKK